MVVEQHPEVVEEEWLIVRNSGEIPEIALHSSLHYLTEDSEGPGMELDTSVTDYLKEAAQARYREIVLRDILPENRDSSSYRGLQRSICNWRRYKRFCSRHDIDVETFKREVARVCTAFLRQDIADVEQGLRTSSINCSIEELRSFSFEVGIVLEEVTENIEQYCLVV